MKKNIIITIIAVAILGAGTFAVGAYMNRPVLTEDTEAPSQLLDELKVGRYYLENGTAEEYIEVFDDGTIQMFGMDYCELICEVNADMVSTMNEEELAEFKSALQEDTVFWNSRHYYVLDTNIPTIGFSDVPVTDEIRIADGCVYTYTDENTIIYDKSLGMIYHYSE